MIFEIKEEHIKLLKEMRLSLFWNDTYGFGAPAFDPNRPFGFSSGILKQIHEIIMEESRELTLEEEDYYMKLFRETLIVLQIGTVFISLCVFSYNLTAEIRNDFCHFFIYFL